MFENEKVLGAPKQTELEDLVGYSMFKGMADFDFPTGEPEFTKEMIDNVQRVELKATGQNKLLPYYRLKENNPQLFDD